MQDAGRTTVSENVFQAIAEITLKNIDDVVEKEKKGALAGLSKIVQERFSPQITVKKTEQEDADFGDVGFELKLAVIYGVNIPEAATKVRKALAEKVESITGYKVTQINIVVDRIIELKELESKAADEKQ
jgi:uncharacterized alkaline shock family protein YloU